MIYLLDTDIIIYWFKGNKNISDKIKSIGFNNIASSVITKTELYYGAFKSTKEEKNLAMIDGLAKKIQFLPFNNPCQIRFAKIKATLERKGTPLDDLDLMIAATAISYDLTLVTNNTKHFSRINEMNLENWT